MGDVINTANAIFVEYEEPVVLLGPESGEAPTTADTFTNVRCVRVVQSASGSRLDFADLEYRLTESLEDREQPASFARIVEVRLPDVDETRIAFGDYVTEAFSVTQSGETLKAQCQLRPYHFGEPVTGYRVWDAIDDEQVKIADHVVFNPTVDDKTVFNRSNKSRSEAPGDGFTGYLWAHPELADSSIGETYQGQIRREWQLWEAVQSICELLNPTEEFIDRPLFNDLFPLLEAPPLRNVTIPIGTYLPKALDILLIPLGYNHYIDYAQDPPIIQFFKIGEGEEKELNFPAVGTVVNPATADVNQLSVTNSIGDKFNEVIALGEFEEAEITIPLYAAWPSAGDSLDADDLSKDGTSYDANQSAWRLFIANEAGDLDPTVSRLGQLPAVPDFGTVFTIATPHRRVMGEPLTYQANSSSGSNKKQKRPVMLEYSTDSGSTWKPEEADWTIKLCPDQIGVYFDGKDIPRELYEAGSSFRMRITGTVFGDYRIRGLAAKQSWAVNARTVQQVLLVPEKFQRRWRQASGTYASVLTGDADERTDLTEIEDYAEKIRDQNHFAELDCEFRLPGWYTEYKIGDLITKVAGREISLDGAPESAPSRRYVQIVERRFEMSADGGPSTVLIVDRGIAT
jgi:hypothetical protein